MSFLRKLFQSSKKIPQTTIPPKRQSIHDYPFETKIKRMYLGIPPTLYPQQNEKNEENNQSQTRRDTGVNTEDLSESKTLFCPPQINEPDLLQIGSSAVIYDVDYEQDQKNDEDSTEEAEKEIKIPKSSSDFIFSKFSSTTDARFPVSESNHPTSRTNNSTITQDIIPKISIKIDSPQNSKTNENEVQFIFRKEHFSLQ